MLVNKLNHLLANLVVEYHKLQNFHWYIKGSDFFTVHAKLEDYYNDINKAVDEVAESILMLEGKPLASLKDFAANASIKEAEAQFIKSDIILAEVEKDYSLLLAEVIEIKKAADAEENFIISAMMDDYIKNFTKAVWMLKQVKA
jgi:starvation-inducible DNA-binding protein